MPRKKEFRFTVTYRMPTEETADSRLIFKTCKRGPDLILEIIRKIRDKHGEETRLVRIDPPAMTAAESK